MAQAWEIENFLDIRDNQLYFNGISAVALAREFGTPLFIFSEDRIRHNISRLKRAEFAIGCPLKVCYAAKANSTMGILRAVKDAGSDLEVNSGGELWKALEIGFTGDQIIFNGTSKEVWELEMAINAGIYAIQVDSVYELSLIESTAQRLGKRANVSLRLVPEIETSTHSGLQTALRTSKFGMMPDEAFSAFDRYSNSPHLDLCGVHLHIGSQNPESEPYAKAFTMLFESLLRVYRETGIRLKHINLGGGFPVNYLRDRSLESAFPSEQRAMFQADFEPSDAIREAWDAVRIIAESAGAADLLNGITLLIEPGRSVVSDAGVCLTTVRNHKSRPVDDESHRTDEWLLTDAGFNILLSMETYKWYYHLISAERSAENHDTPYKLAGPLCDGGDVYFDIEGQNRLPDHRRLPADVKTDEILALLNCGAYSLAQASQYNGRFLPPVILIRSNGTAEVIRERDSFADLVARDIY
ncbi:MAG: diaminopimelate decarboxylase [Chloracidobacterium sp.]|nr:diaminopimelate decarboxylase [Chloracidobacterium sp.]